MKINKFKIFESHNIQNTIFSEYFDRDDKINEYKKLNEKLKKDLVIYINLWFDEKYEYINNKYDLTDKFRKFIVAYQHRTPPKILPKITIDSFYMTSDNKFILSAKSKGLSELISLDLTDLKKLNEYIETKISIEEFNI